MENLTTGQKYGDPDNTATDERICTLCGQPHTTGIMTNNGPVCMECIEAETSGTGCF